jgi:hypothetical protein
LPDGIFVCSRNKDKTIVCKEQNRFCSFTIASTMMLNRMGDSGSPWVLPLLDLTDLLKEPPCLGASHRLDQKFFKTEVRLGPIPQAISISNSFCQWTLSYAFDTSRKIWYKVPLVALAMSSLSFASMMAVAVLRPRRNPCSAGWNRMLSVGRFLKITFHVASKRPMPRTPSSDLVIGTRCEKQSCCGTSPVLKTWVTACTNWCHSVLSSFELHAQICISLLRIPDGPAALTFLSWLTAARISSSVGIWSFTGVGI